jgi:hypothetical protein
MITTSRGESERAEMRAESASSMRDMRAKTPSEAQLVKERREGEGVLPVNTCTVFARGVSCLDDATFLK